MEDEVILERFNNLDRRLSNVEQVLPTLATKEDLAAVRSDLRRHMDVIGESLRGDIQLIAENLAAVLSRRQP